MMPTIFRLDASIRDQGSVTRELANQVEATLLDTLGEATVTRRDVGLSPLPATAWAGAVFGPHVPAEERSPEQAQGMALAQTLADELLAADAYIFALPFYNFGVSQHFKAFVDLLLTDPRFAPGQAPLLAGRPAQLIIARGGGYGPGTPRHGWDHGTSWYRRVLEDILKLEVEVIECELTLAEVNPAMAELRPMAAENLAKAQAAAQRNGRALADKLAPARVIDLAVAAR